MTRVGSLFSGYGGLDMAVHAVLGGTTAWVSDIDPGASSILAHRYPHAPNLGDVATVNWAQVEPVDVLTGGFPCQDVSHAGARAGLGPGTRSGLWSRMADAIDHLRPSLVIAENVRGLLSAEAASDVEPCPWCLGDGGGEPPLRALGAVLADLAELGYDASWHGLRAADVGAPHGRFRVFITAWPAGAAPDTDRVGPVRAGRPRRRGPGPADSRGHAAPDAQGDGRDEGRPKPAGLLRGPDASVGGDAPAHPDGHGLQGVERDGATTSGGRRPADAGGAATTNPDGNGLGGLPQLHAATEAGIDGQRGRHPDGLGVETGGMDWGAYTPAIRRWEHLLGRPAPAPTERGSKGQPRLSPPFVEWMMGLPAGWVTDTPGLSRNDQLKALGNGVVPQQAAAALRFLLARLGEEQRWAA